MENPSSSETQNKAVATGGWGSFDNLQLQLKCYACILSKFYLSTYCFLTTKFGQVFPKSNTTCMVFLEVLNLKIFAPDSSLRPSISPPHNPKDLPTALQNTSCPVCPTKSAGKKQSWVKSQRKNEHIHWPKQTSSRKSAKPDTFKIKLSFHIQLTQLMSQPGEWHVPP